MSESETSVEAVGVSKVYWDGSKRLDILKNVSLVVQPGEGVAILGPSGSGKTTLLNILSGLDRPTEGVVRLGGLNLAQQDAGQKALYRNQAIGFVFQFYHLLPEFSALENVMLPALIGHKDKTKQAIQQKAEMLLERVGLKDRLTHFPSELSGGEQQRVAMARALVNDPQILFCDEPTGNLDPATGLEIAGLIKDFFMKEKKTVLVATHDERIARMASRVWSMVSGDWMP